LACKPEDDQKAVGLRLVNGKNMESVGVEKRNLQEAPRGYIQLESSNRKKGVGLEGKPSSKRNKKRLKGGGSRTKKVLGGKNINSEV